MIGSRSFSAISAGAAPASFAPPPGLAVDADPDLHLVVAAARRSACPAAGTTHEVKRHPQAAAAGRSPCGPRLGHASLRSRPFGRRGAGRSSPATTVDPDPAPSGGVEAVLVPRRRRRPPPPPPARSAPRGQLGGHLEVHHVARVVLDHVQHPGPAVDGRRRGRASGSGVGDVNTSPGRPRRRASPRPTEPPVQRLGARSRRPRPGRPCPDTGASPRSDRRAVLVSSTRTRSPGCVGRHVRAAPPRRRPRAR